MMNAEAVVNPLKTGCDTKLNRNPAKKTSADHRGLHQSNETDVFKISWNTVATAALAGNQKRFKMESPDG